MINSRALSEGKVPRENEVQDRPVIREPSNDRSILQGYSGFIAHLFFHQKQKRFLPLFLS